jgi:nuclear transport factor 2 (NTF2) superfamily protein
MEPRLADCEMRSSYVYMAQGMWNSYSTLYVWLVSPEDQFWNCRSLSIPNWDMALKFMMWNLRSQFEQGEQKPEPL